MSKKRAIAVITLYVYGDTEKELYQESKRIEKKINSFEDCKASLENLYNSPFGSIDSDIKKININKFKY